ncbi:glycosyltransferase family 2 protein [Actomonas aquatica]|uniref:Glycosyltransferase family 2 protein n=1 Tax=Actomonas aquatica TaxID=2866162 RepID=A0ABZ1CAD5_9BACT|nr:glycosyltransferase family 2 protein [Opitutus sp. WL0086]WRQ88491.1 glycosyltransferase family 2 protein [Opitutus sp. WL0086]
MDDAPVLSIVVPVYRSESILPKLVAVVATEMKALGLEGQFELILVNDASPDNSWDVILELATANPWVKGVGLRRNFGQHNATMAGLNLSSGCYVVIMDDDLQHPPSAIAELLSALKEGYDVCYTNYRNRKHALWKKVGSRFNDWVATRLLSKPTGLYLSSFKAMRREVVNEIVRYDGPYPYIDGLILDVTRSIATIDIEHQERESGAGNYNLINSVSLWLKMATSFSVFPLRVVSFLGITLSFLSMLMLVAVVVGKLMYPDIQAGWASVVTTILFIGGIQTLCLGMIGEYMGRTYLKLNKKPQFSVGRLVNVANKSNE